MPLDPAFPQQRLDFMLTDSGASVLVTTERHAARFRRPGLSIIELDRFPLPPHIQQENFSSLDVALDDPIYVLYTSGSTGVPKGVIGLHRGVVNRLQWMWDAYPFSAGEVPCQKTALSFVDSVAEIFGPLLKGVPIVISATKTCAIRTACSILCRGRKLRESFSCPQFFRRSSISRRI